MQIAVTGGKGFIGSHVAHWAEQAGHEVMFFDRRGGHDTLGNLLPMVDADAIIHLAGVLGTMELFDTIDLAIEQNVLGSARVAQFCSEHDIQYVGILVPDVFPSIYCATKYGAKRITDAMHEAGRLQVSHVIAYNAFGPGQAYGPGHPRKFGPTFSVAALNGEPIPIWGDGTALLDPVPVEVVARMLVDACSHPDNPVFDGGIGISVTVNEIADRMADYAEEATGNPTVPHAYEPMRIGETPTNVAATGRGWERLDWDPTSYQAVWQARLKETVRSYIGVPFDGEFVGGKVRTASQVAADELLRRPH